MRCAIFLDRDGVINEKMPDGQYVTRWEEFHFLPGVAEAIRAFNDMGFLVVVVTNQRGIAKGLYTEEDLEGIHRKMCEEIEQAGGRIDAIYYCPHDIHENCNCRKPRPGMILKAAEELGIDLTSSYLIGDSITDIQCGKEAGVGVNMLIRQESRVERRETKDERRESRVEGRVVPDIIVGCLEEAVDEIVRREARDRGRESRGKDQRLKVKDRGSEFRFERLDVWNKAMKWADEIYSLTRRFPEEER